MNPALPTQLAAIDALGRAMFIMTSCVGVLMIMLAISSHMRRPTWWWDAATISFTFVAVLTMCWLAFDPAVYTTKFFTGPIPFVLIGSMLAGSLFYLRAVRKDIYGTVEVAVALATLAFVGAHYSPNKIGSDVIGFVGAVYVLVRGLSNIAETFQSRSKS